jgi:PqqD family protein of HPr-rel-A system
MSMQAKKPQQLPGADIHEAADGFVVYQAENGQVHFFNNTALVIFELCDGEHSTQDIAAYVRDAFELAETPLQEVEDTVSQFVDKGLVQFTT